ncbi:hypothetical protein L9F63_016946, partial [Diploptera punctata]
IQTQPNHGLENIINSLDFIRNPHISARIKPEPLSNIIIPFQQDYLVYWGSVNTPTCSHLILWFICRQPIGISKEQIAKFRNITDITNEPMLRNYRETQFAKDSVIFHVLPSDKTSTTLLQIEQSQSHKKSRRENQNSSQPMDRESTHNHGSKLPPEMIQREILVQPTSFNINHPFIPPEMSRQYLHTPKPMFVPVINGELAPNYKNMYSYAPMMFPYPTPQYVLHGARNKRESSPIENETSESDIHSTRKDIYYKNPRKIETGNMKSNKTTEEEEEQKITFKKVNKNSKDSNQNTSSKDIKKSTNVVNKRIQYPYELENMV